MPSDTSSDQKSILCYRGRKVNLRPLGEADLLFFCRWLNDPDIAKYLNVVPPLTEAAERAWFEKFSTSNTDAIFAIETSEGRLIGDIGLMNINWRDRVAVSGTIIGEPADRGKGYGTDAKILLLCHAFQVLNLRKVCSSAYDFNDRSLQYNLRCGYKEEGRKREQAFRSGRYCDEILIAVFRDDWLPLWEQYRETGRL